MLYWGYAQRVSAMMKGVSDFRYSQRRRRTMRLARRVLRLPQTDRHHFAALGDWQLAVHSRLPESSLKEVFPQMLNWPEGYDLY